MLHPLLQSAQAAATVRRQFHVHPGRTDRHLSRHDGLTVLSPADEVRRLPAQYRREHAADAAEMLLHDNGGRKLRWQVVQNDGQGVQPPGRRQQDHQLNRRTRFVGAAHSLSVHPLAAIAQASRGISAMRSDGTLDEAPVSLGWGRVAL
jgi:hypothetical protein